MIFNQKGYTLVELSITFGIMTIIFLLAMSFFIVCYNNYLIINNDAELQFQAQYILNFVSNKIMESRNVEFIKSGTKSVINSTNEFEISKLSLKYGEYDHHCYVFDVRHNKIFFGNGYYNDSAAAELGTYVVYLKATPLPKGKTFKEARALKLTLKLMKEESVYEASQIIFMRNS